MDEVLNQLLTEANASLKKRSVTDDTMAARIEYVCQCLGNRAGVRLVMSCMLAKIDVPKVDPREPYTKIHTDTCFSGRTYDEQYLAQFINKNKLPCNPTTAFLTPAFRNLDRRLLVETAPVGRPQRLYTDSIAILNDVAEGRATARDVLLDCIRILLSLRAAQEQRMESLLEGIEGSKDSLPPSSEAIVTLLEQHLACKNSSRLPVLGVASAYTAVSTLMGERALPLKGHNSADEQTGASGDVEVCLVNDEKVVTVYEMKKKSVLINDIDRAVTKIGNSPDHVDNYIFITTDTISADVADYARSMYEATSGTEIVILDYIGFVRHFLHLFHRYRAAFLDAYQSLVLSEPASAVPQSLKEAFLSLRSAWVADEGLGAEELP